jgi:hypothetical protein
MVLWNISIGKFSIGYKYVSLDLSNVGNHDPYTNGTYHTNYIIIPGKYW